LKGIQARIRDHAWRIATGSGLLGNVRPLGMRVVRRRPRPSGPEGVVVVVAVQAFGVDGLGPSPSRPGFVFQRVPAAGPVPRGFVGGSVACRLVARGLRSGGRRWGQRRAMLDYAGTGSGVGRINLVDVVPLGVVFLVVFLVFFFFFFVFGFGVLLPLATGRDLDARVVFLVGVGVVVMLCARRMVDGDVSPKLNLDVSVASITARGRYRNSSRRRYRNAGRGGGCARDTRGRRGRGSTTNRAARKRPPGRGSALMRKGYD